MTTTTGPATVPATALALFSPQEVQRFDLVVADLANVQKHLEGLVIKDQGGAVAVHNGLAETKRLRELAEMTRKAQVSPLNDQVRVLNNAWRPLTDALDKLEATAKRTLLAWNQAEAERVAREQEAARKAREEAARKEREALAKAEATKSSKVREREMAKANAASQELMAARVAEPMAAPTGIKTDHGSSWTRLEWVHKVVDPQAVPREFLAVDEKAIRAAVAKGVRDIPGVTIYQEEQIATRVG